MGGRKYKDITIQGVTYPTAQAAAKALGISEVTVQRACRLGLLETCGSGASHPRAMPCRIAGRDFPTVKAAAKHFKVTPAAIYHAIEAGDVDRIARPAPPCTVNCKPFSVGPLSWPSMSAAERDLGLARGYIRNTRQRGSQRGEQRIMAAAMAVVAKQGQLAARRRKEANK